MTDFTIGDVSLAEVLVFFSITSFVLHSIDHGITIASYTSDNNRTIWRPKGLCEYRLPSRTIEAYWRLSVAIALCIYITVKHYFLNENIYIRILFITDTTHVNICHIIYTWHANTDFLSPNFHLFSLSSKECKNSLISQRTSWLGDHLLALVCNSFDNILMLTAGCLQSLDFWPSLPQLKLIGLKSDFPS